MTVGEGKKQSSRKSKIKLSHPPSSTISKTTNQNTNHIKQATDNLIGQE